MSSRNSRMFRAVSGLILFLFGAMSQAGAAVYLDSAGFDAAIAGYSAVGSEDFEGTVTDDYGTDLTSLNGTVLNSVLGLRITAGSGYLYGLGPLFGSGVNSRSVWDVNGDGMLTLTIEPSSGALVTALRLNVLSNDDKGGTGTPLVQAYDPLGNLLASGSASGTMDSTTGFFGIVVDPSQDIRTVVLTPDANWFVGVDNAFAFTAVPEPASYGLAGCVVLLGTTVVLRGRKPAKAVA